MQYARPETPAGFAGALPLYLAFVFAVFAGLAGVIYWQLQPTVRSNPGVAAYKAPPATVVASAPARAPSQAGAPLADFAQAKPEPAPAGIKDAPAKPVAEAKQDDSTPPAVEVRKKERKVAKRHRREQVARERSRDPRADYAAQQNNNGFRPWSYDRSAQRSGGFRPWF